MPDQPGEIDFWFSIGSTYSHLSVMRLPAMAAREGIAPRWRPFDVRAIMILQNNISFRGKPEKSACMWRDIARRAARHKLRARLPAPYPLKDLGFVNQVALLGMEEGRGIAFARAACRSWFEEGRMPDGGKGLEKSLRAAGQAPEAAIARARSPAIAARLAEETETARKADIFGSPGFMVGDELFWGDDRMEDAFAWARHGRLI